MEEKKDKDIEKPNGNNRPAEKDTAPQHPAEAKNNDFDDDAATAEEMEAFIRDRREKEKQERKEDKTDVFGEYSAPENSIDPYLEPDPTLPWVKYEEGLFLSRGCKRCPE